jgi:hypothetical protein
MPGQDVIVVDLDIVIDDDYFCRSATTILAGRRARPEGSSDSSSHSGPMVTDEQVRLLRQKIMEGRSKRQQLQPPE